MDSFEQLMVELEQGDEAAQARVWLRYFEHLVERARRHLADRFRRVSDEEDVALSVLNSLYRGFERQKYPDLQDRDELWGLMLTMLRRKAINQAKRECRQKRGEGMVRGDSAWS